MPAPERREHILRSASKVFSRKGYRLTSVSDIVEEASIGRGTFYLYFESKRDIFRELIESYFENYTRILQENHHRLIAAFREPSRILGTWRDNMLRVLRYAAENPDLTNIVYREALGKDEDFSDRVEELSRLARGMLKEEFQIMYDRGMMRACDIEVVTSIIMGSTVYLVMEQLLAGNEDVERLTDAMVEYHIRALIPDEGDVKRALRSALGGS